MSSLLDVLLLVLLLMPIFDTIPVFISPIMTSCLLPLSCLAGTDDVRHENEMDLFEAIDENVSYSESML